jgi:hypothetical protein
MGQGRKTPTEAYFSQCEELKMRPNGNFEEGKLVQTGSRKKEKIRLASTLTFLISPMVTTLTHLHISISCKI